MKGAKRQRRCETVELPFELWMMVVECIAADGDAVSLRAVMAMAFVCVQWSYYVREFFARRLAEVRSITRSSPLSVPLVTHGKIAGAWLTVYKPSQRPMIAVPFHLFDETPVMRPEEYTFIDSCVFEMTATTGTAFYCVSDGDNVNIKAITVDRITGQTLSCVALNEDDNYDDTRHWDARYVIRTTKDGRHVYAIRGLCGTLLTDMDEYYHHLSYEVLYVDPSNKTVQMVRINVPDVVHSMTDFEHEVIDKWFATILVLSTDGRFYTFVLEWTEPSTGAVGQFAARLPANGGTVNTVRLDARDHYDITDCRRSASQTTRRVPEYDIVMKTSVDDRTGEIVVRCINAITRSPYWERRTNVGLFVDDYRLGWTTAQLYDDDGSIIVSCLKNDHNDPNGKLLYWLLT
jgi:hypothetical protein